MNAQIEERRRTHRLWLTVPIQAEGSDTAGQEFKSDARVINLSRHGARIQFPLLLAQEQIIRINSLDGKHRADFKVVGVMAPHTNGKVEYGAECLNERQNFWQIEFPPPENIETEVARVLLECRTCNTVALLPLSLSEVQAVRSMGWVGKSCPLCAKISLWKYAQVGNTQPLSDDRSKGAIHGTPHWITAAMESSGRNHRRVYVIMPLGVRDSQGDPEITQTENISKCGFCFTSSRNHQPGEVITAIFDNAADSLTHKTELPAKIVREQPILGAHRKLYGAIYC